MALLVDGAHWEWRDRMWCHLVSDTSLDELHAFAADLGVPERGFQGDHYDIPHEIRELAIAGGALEVTSKEVVLALYAAGLRRPRTTPPTAPPAAPISGSVGEIRGSFDPISPTEPDIGPDGRGGWVRPG